MASDKNPVIQEPSIFATQKRKFVSRGGDKLQKALDTFNLNVLGKIVLDVGSSTGGFVDCLLQNGVTKVYSVDTAYGELSWKLRNDSRVVVMERTNILHLDFFPQQVDLITIDAGWTKLELVLPKVKKFLKKNGQIIALLKPHYETEAKNLVKGVVKPEALERVVESVKEKIKGLEFKIENQVRSPILGSHGKGNIEFLLSIVPES